MEGIHFQIQGQNASIHAQPTPLQASPGTRDTSPKGDRMVAVVHEVQDLNASVHAPDLELVHLNRTALELSGSAGGSPLLRPGGTRYGQFFNQGQQLGGSSIAQGARVTKVYRG